jgi:hypothetical protein
VVTASRSYTILTKGNKFVENWQDKGKQVWTSRGDKLGKGKYVEETNDR